ncbi:MAG TPA: ATP-binding cassette domain-containing protein, partial [Ilumatobacteraceae bacterium]|nr:ATP-binding cassette domain-containing protein [Ilumatobacteraceae bacterium]
MNTSRSNRPQSQRTRAKRSTPTAAAATSPDDTSNTTFNDESTAGSSTTSEASTRSERPVGPPPTIETIGLTKRYGDAPALWPIDLRIGAGERISLIGHNGSGKTTLMRMLVGMLEPSEGTATIAGHPIGSIEARAAVSYLADQPVFYDDLTVWEHLE